MTTTFPAPTPPFPPIPPPALGFAKHRRDVGAEIHCTVTYMLLQSGAQKGIYTRYFLVYMRKEFFR